MYKINLRKKLHGCLYLLSGMALLTTSCVDNNYDFSKDIDLTMGFGSEGLTVKLGTTDTILLKDVLEENENTKVDSESRYYLIEDGEFDTQVDVADVTAKIQKIDFTSANPILDIDKVAGVTGVTSVTVPSNKNITGTGSGASVFNFNFSNVDASIEQISKIYPATGTKVRLFLAINQPSNLKFEIQRISNLKITVPDFMVLDKSLIEAPNGVTVNVDGQTISFGDITSLSSRQPLCTIGTSTLDLKGHGQVQNGNIYLPDEICNVKVSGDFQFGTSQSFTMNKADKVNMNVVVTFNESITAPSSNVTISQVKGTFNPVIDPTVDPIDIASSLPDFLQDDDVKMEMTNPTLKIVADLSNQNGNESVPFDIFLGGEIMGHKDNIDYKAVKLKMTTPIQGAKENYLYFSQLENDPYDPAGVAAGALKAQANLTDLLRPSIPDLVSINLSDGQVHVDQSKEYTVKLNTTYRPKMKYQILVPFTFNKGFQIVYNDSTDTFGDDLKDLAGKGLLVTAGVHTMVPLNLTVEAQTMDASGKIIPLEAKAIAKVSACKSDKEEIYPIELNANLVNPADLSRISYIRFKVHAEADQNEGGKDLKSNQYVFLSDIRARLHGQVIVDLN